MTKATEDSVTVRGTGNVFADLGYADADTHLLKAGLVSRIHDVVLEQELNQTEAATLMGLSQPDVSRLLRGQFRDISVERLMRMLTTRLRGRHRRPCARRQTPCQGDTIHLLANRAESKREGQMCK